MSIIYYLRHVTVNLFLQNANSEGGKQPIHLGSRIVAFAFYCLNDIVHKVSTSKFTGG